jgi:hypothetical protein
MEASFVDLNPPPPHHTPAGPVSASLNPSPPTPPAAPLLLTPRPTAPVPYISHRCGGGDLGGPRPATGGRTSQQLLRH